jgi:hypothetical protein
MTAPLTNWIWDVGFSVALFDAHLHLRLTNIDFGPPLETEIDGRDPRSIPHYLLDKGSLS